MFTDNQWVLDTVEQGYKIELTHIPSFTGVRETKIKDSIKLGVLLEEVDTLWQKKVIEPVSPQEEHEGYYSNFFVVPKKPQGYRPILNLRPLNRFVKKAHFRMENLRSVKRPFSRTIGLPSSIFRMLIITSPSILLSENFSVSR